jgi:hypothetical protein
MHRSALLLVATLGLASCSSGNLCATKTCDGSATQYRQCATPGDTATYSFGGQACSCPYGATTQCAACAALLSAYCGAAPVGDLAGSPGMLAPPPKTGSDTGSMTNPAYTSESDCPDEALEPDDTIATAVDLSPLQLMPDGPAAVLQDLAICPNGPNPRANGGHDVDVYRLVVPTSVGATVNMTYDVTGGDLDLGIYDAGGALLAGDGTAVSDACVATALPMGTYYVAVFGANGVASNGYSLGLRWFSTPSAATCPSD